MRRAKVIYDDVRAAQELLGTGQVEEAFSASSALRDEAKELMRSASSLTSFERTHAAAAFTYATVTLVLSLAEKDPPAVSIPLIRELAAEAARLKEPRSESWKVLAAAAEMLARSGDALGASWAAKKAQQVGTETEYLRRLAGGISSMYPQVFASIPPDPPDDPPGDDMSVSNI